MLYKVTQEHRSSRGIFYSYEIDCVNNSESTIQVESLGYSKASVMIEGKGSAAGSVAIKQSNGGSVFDVPGTPTLTIANATPAFVGDISVTAYYLVIQIDPAALINKTGSVIVQVTLKS